MGDIISRLANRIYMMLGRAILKSVDDTKAIQLIKVAINSNELQDGIERVQDYGFTSVPPSNGEALMGYINGNRDSGIAISCDSGEHRPTGFKDGECAQYSKHGQMIKMLLDGSTNATQSGTFDVGNGSDFVAMSAKVDALWDAFYNMFTTWGPVANDGGAALKTQFTVFFPAPGPSPVASTNLKAD